MSLSSHFVVSPMVNLRNANSQTLRQQQPFSFTLKRLWQPPNHVCRSSSEFLEPVPIAAAGIPVAALYDDTLWLLLQERPEVFAATIVSAWRQLAEQYDEALEAEGAREQETAASPQAGRAGGAAGSGGATLPVNSRSTDLVYAWAIAEAYCLHPLLQETMRVILRREGLGPLAAADTTKLIATNVQLLQQCSGSYQVGSVRFVNDGSSTSTVTGIAAGSVLVGSKYGVLTPLGVVQEAEHPRSISRAAAARAYMLYTHWGYFNRHMTTRKERTRAMLGEQYVQQMAEDRAWMSGKDGSGTRRMSTQYGEVTKIWRYFENVPEELSEMRTGEARSAADRHVATLFGEQEECITTMAAWKHMCDEAQWWGRALYDAEQVAIDEAPQVLQEMWSR